VRDGEKQDDKAVSHRFHMHIAKMANLSQYCISSGGIVWQTKTLVAAKSGPGASNRNDIFAPLVFQNTIERTTTKG
jgi:hypothetical protein